MSLKIYIVEDEPLITATIETALLKHGFIVLGDADEVSPALKDIDTLNPDLVLIDIQLDGTKDGIDLAQELDKREQPYIFLTSQTDPQTVNRVKETRPIGYIAKPFTEAGLRSNIEIAWHNHSSKEIAYLIIRVNGQLHKINQNTILYLKAFDNYCYVFTKTKTFLVPHTLKHLSKELDTNSFIKTHRSYYVNIKHINALSSSSVVIDDQSIPVSSSHKAAVFQSVKA